MGRCVTTRQADPSATRLSKATLSRALRAASRYLKGSQTRLDKSLREELGSSFPAATPSQTSSTPLLVNLGAARRATDGTIVLSLIVEGRSTSYTVPRHVAAAMVADLAKALADTPPHMPSRSHS